MDFWTSVKTCFKNYVSFKGRASRSEFWFFQLFIWVVSIALSTAGTQTEAFSSIGALFSVATVLPSLSVSFRRLHDTDHSGWWLLLMLLPIIGWIWLVVIYARAGTVGPNRFGPDSLQMYASSF
jgi:uncharacterized membrane protein YhaH (DUF805 family)